MTDVDDLELDDEQFQAVRAQLRAAWTRQGGSVDDMPKAIQASEAATQLHDEYVMPRLAKADDRVNYRAAGEGGDERCYGCRFYQWGTCGLVEGGIEAEDVCDLYTAPLATAPPSMFAVRDDGDAPKLHVYQPVELAEPPDWSPFLPTPGRYDHPVYGELDFSPDTYARIIANFKSGIYQERIPVNAEHDPHAAGAIGWITDMRLAESGAIEAKVEWNERGKALIEGDRYAYVSAEVMPVWNDPVEPDKEYRDVAVGLALTTHPYFKERVLPPLAASEAVLTRHAGESGKEARMSEHNAQQQTPPAANEQAAQEDTPVTHVTEQTPGNLSAAQLNEKAVSEFRALKADFTKTQQLVAKLSDENAALKKDTVLKWATDEVRGRSDENGTPWLGDIAGHVTLLCDLAGQFGKDSTQVTQYVETNRAHAEQMKASDLFREFGTGRSPEGSGQARIDAAVEALLASDTTLTRAQATTRVLTERPELYDEYQRERR